MSELVKKLGIGIGSLDSLREASKQVQRSHEESVVLCLDVSGSMTSDLPALREAAGAFLLACNPRATKAGVVSFSNDIKIEARISDRLQQAAAAAMQLTARGGTSVCLGLSASISMLKAEGSRLRRIILMTDGQDESTFVEGNSNRVVSVVSPHTSWLVVDTVAFGDEADEELLRKLASMTGGTFRHVKDGASLVREFKMLEAGVRGLLTEAK